MKKSMKFATALAGAAVVVVGGTAFTASNTVPTTFLGNGSATVSGVTVTGIAYELDVSGEEVTAATFTTTENLKPLSPDPTVVSVLSDDADAPLGTDIACDTDTTANKIVCTYDPEGVATEILVADVENVTLRVS